MSVASKHVKNFVEAGGNCLILGSHAMVTTRSTARHLAFGSGSLSLGGTEGEATALPLEFFDKSSNRYISIGGNDTSAQEAVHRRVSLRSLDGILIKGIHESISPPTGQSNGIHPNQTTSIIAQYTSDNEEEQGGVACWSLDVNDGRLVVWIPNIEYPLGESLFVSTPHQPCYKFLPETRNRAI